MNYALSDDEIHSVLGKFKPMLYSELKDYPTIEDLLKKDYEWRIILLETKENTGHWVCIMRKTDNDYYYFNSYGDSYNKDLYLIPRMMRKILGQDDNFLNKLLIDKNVEYSKTRFQGNNSSVCGRYVMFVIDYCMNLKNTLKEAISFLKSKKKELGLSYDNTIIALTNKVKPSTIPLNLL
jgi:hypothetical protein